MRAVASALLALVVTGTALGAASSGPTLSVRDRSPLTVRGAHFRPREHVVLRVAYQGAHTRRVQAGPEGRFSSRFRLSIPTCAIYRVSARGDAGSGAVYRSPIPVCGNPP